MFIKDRAKTTTPDREALSGVVLPMFGFSRRSRCTVCGPCRLAGAYVFLAAGNRYAKACQNRLCQTLLTGVASGPVSRVLLSTAIYLDAPLPVRSSHLHGTAGPAICPSAVLLRIEFTAPRCLQPASELLPHFSTLTRSLGRFVSVALVRGSPLWSPDFPHAQPFGSCPRLSGLLARLFYTSCRTASSPAAIYFLVIGTNERYNLHV